MQRGDLQRLHHGVAADRELSGGELVTLVLGERALALDDRG